MRCRSRCLALIVAAAHVDSGCIAHSTRQLPPSQLRPGRSTTGVVGAVRASGERLVFPGESPAVVVGNELCISAGWQVDLHVVPRADVREPRRFGHSRPAKIALADGRTLAPSRMIEVNDREVRFETREPLAETTGFVEIPAADVVERSRDASGGLQSVRTRQGRSYSGFRVLSEDASGLRLELADRRSCRPLADFQQLAVRQADAGKTFLYTVGGLAVAWGVALGLVIAFKESCPFVYSHDGRGYVFDAEPYGGAISAGLERTDLCRLEHLAEQAGRCRLRLANEVDETQHTDELKLVVVDHPDGSRVVPDEGGELHLVAGVRAPASARDRLGRDLLPLVSARDTLSWESRLGTLQAAWEADSLREELTFEFPKPRGARRARLLVDGGSTLWASQMLKRFLELHGREVSAWYARVDSSAAARDAIRGWSAREETYRLQLRVRTPAGWLTRAVMSGGGPFATEERAYVLDVSDVPGDTLCVRLRPPAGFWALDSVAVDYGDGRASAVRELAPVRALDDAGGDVRDALRATDGRYVSMPRTGQSAELEFAGLPTRHGGERSFFVKVSGYYDIHLPRAGEPRRELLTRYVGEPGFAVRYALEEYRRAVAESLASARP